MSVVGVLSKMKIDAKSIMEDYPKLNVKDRKGKLFEMNGDLLFLFKSGRIERITDGVVISQFINKRIRYTFEILEWVLIDEGVENVDS